MVLNQFYYRSNLGKLFDEMSQHDARTLLP